MSSLTTAGVVALILGDVRKRRSRLETEAVYADGVLRPVETLDIPDGTSVHVIVEAEGVELAEAPAVTGAPEVPSGAVPAAAAAAEVPVGLPPAVPTVQPRPDARAAAVPVTSQVWLVRLGWIFLALGLFVYLATRLWRITQFPIYFFTDEATFALLANELLTHGLRDGRGTLLPLYFEVAGNRWTPVLAVYAHLPAVALFGKSVLAVRATSALVTFLAPVAVALILKLVFRIRYWWAGALIMAVVPTWFLHSRTAFEWMMMASFYACFLLSYLLYRTRSPNYLFAAIAFGAATFYNHASGQLIMAAVAILLAASDFRYHVQNWRTVLLGLLMIGLLAVPLLRLRAQQPQAMLVHLRAVDSYWFLDKPLIDKLQQFARTYLYGLSPGYWFLPNGRDLVRHRMSGYGNLGLALLPFALAGTLLCLRRVRSSTHRAVLLAALAAPAGAAMADVAITRMMAFVPPACVIAGLGLDLILEWVRTTLQSSRMRLGVSERGANSLHAAMALVVFAVLSGASLLMLRDALTNGPTWYSDYGLYGMQYGARQLFVEAIPEYLEENPDATVLVSPNWANGADTFIRFFLPPDQQFTRVQMHDVNYFMVDRRPLNSNMVLVMTEDEYARAKASGKFKVIDVERTIPYPDGRPGFHFARLAYADDLDEIIAREREERSRPVLEEVAVDGQTVQLLHSQLDIGVPSSLFDGDTFTLVRGLEANPLVFEFTFPEPRKINGLGADFGSMDFTLTAKLYADESGEPSVFSETYRGLPGDPHVDMTFVGAPEAVKKLRLEVLHLNAPTETHIHVRELKFRE